MSCAIRLVAVGHSGFLFPAAPPLYLVEAFPDGDGGLGDERWSFSPYAARRFDDPGQAWLYWKRQSTVRPFREDGLPNRPLTAFTIEIVPLDVPTQPSEEQP